MYPDEKTALAYTVLAEFIEGNGISKDEAYQALSTISEHVRELSSGLTMRATDSAVCTCKVSMPSPDFTIPTCRFCGKPQSR